MGGDGKIKNLGRYGMGIVGSNNPHWKGGITVRKDGRRLIYSPGHPRADSRKYVLEYVLKAEKALGRPLPLRAVVHHLDGDATNNTNSNLVICEDQSYHVYLHARLRAWRACGHPDWRRCTACKRWSSLDGAQVTSKYTRICSACLATRSHRSRTGWEKRKRNANSTLLHEGRQAGAGDDNRDRASEGG